MDVKTWKQTMAIWKQNVLAEVARREQEKAEREKTRIIKHNPISFRESIVQK